MIMKKLLESTFLFFNIKYEKPLYVCFFTFMFNFFMFT